jgi:hypothetical protein
MACCVVGGPSAQHSGDMRALRWQAGMPVVWVCINNGDDGLLPHHPPAHPPTYPHTPTYPRTHTHTPADRHMCVNVCMCVCVRARVCVCACECMCCVCVCTHARMHALTHNTNHDQRHVRHGPAKWRGCNYPAARAYPQHRVACIPFHIADTTRALYPARRLPEPGWKMVRHDSGRKMTSQGN